MELTRTLWEEQDGVGIITLNRPERLNAIDLRTIVELDYLVERTWNRESVRSLIITGAGRAFSAGADVKEWSSPSGGEAEEDKDGWALHMHRLMSRLYRIPKPVIAAVNGVAVGGGCDLSLVADFRIASTSARFGEVYIRVGFSPDAGGTFLLPRLIGSSKAAELIYTGRIIDAQEADKIGLINALVEPDALHVDRDGVGDAAGLRPDGRHRPGQGADSTERGARLRGRAAQRASRRSDLRRDRGSYGRVAGDGRETAARLQGALARGYP